MSIQLGKVARRSKEYLEYSAGNDREGKKLLKGNVNLNSKTIEAMIERFNTNIGK